MAKDPAFLLYTSDFLTGTYSFTDDQVGKYIRLLCLQHQKGEITEKDLKKISGNDDEIMDKFVKNDRGNFENERLKKEILRRKDHGDKQRKKIQDYWDKKHSTEIPQNNNSKTPVIPLETITEDETVTETKNSFGKSENLFTDNFAQIQIWIQALKISDHIFEQKLMSAGLRINKQELCEALDEYEALIAQYPAKQNVKTIEQFRVIALSEVKKWLKNKRDVKPKPMAEIITNDKFKPYVEAQKKRQANGTN